MRVAVIATSSVVPKIEFDAGIKRLKSAGFEPIVHPQVFGKRDLFFAASDAARADAIAEVAWDQDCQVIWAARGGYGAIRLLPLLDSITRQKGRPPKKLLVGFSDVTALLDFVRDRWGWATLHAPMVAMSDVKAVDRVFKKTADLVRGGKDLGWNSKLKCLRNPTSVNGPVVGGNLTVWNALSGTPFARGARDCIAFFEDIGESPSRIDRSVSQLLLSGRLDGARALVLGDFNGCNDTPPTTGTGKKARAIRPKVSTQAALKEIFGAAGERLRCPVFFGAPVGHGPGFLPLPLGGEIQIDLQGRVSLQRWDWDGC